MRELKIVKLRFRSSVHLGANVSGIGIEESQLIAHSDTIFSCLINSYSQLHAGNQSTVKKLLDSFRDGEPPFRITSAFPFETTYNSGIVYYLPKPLVDPPRVTKRDKQKYGKLIRNTQFVQIAAFQNWLTGNRVDLNALENQNVSRFCALEIRPQHARDRLTDATQIYHEGLTHFNHDAGFYFLIELNSASLLNWSEFRAVLKKAGENGLGGRRSHGKGVFEVTNETISDLDSSWEDLFALPQQKGFINLSLCLPESETIANIDPVAYQLVPRKGWCYSSVAPLQRKRQTVTMFGEGSVFRNQPTGILADVTPQKSNKSLGFTNHKIYRYGIPITLPIKIYEEENDVS